MFSRFVQYLKDTKAEMKKVNWPTGSQTVRLTLIVIGISLFVAFFLGFSDIFFQYILKMFFLK